MASNFIRLPVTGGGGGGGTVTQVNTGAGLTGGPITTTGTIAADANLLAGIAGCTFDGGGAVVQAGTIAYLYVPYAGTIASVTMLADQTGSAVVDVWKAPFASFPPTVANTITASDLPTISSAKSSQDSTLTGWTTSVNAGDVIAFKVNSCSAITRLVIELQITRT